MSQQQSLQVELGDRSYPIHVGDLGVQAPEKLAQLLQPLIPGQQVAVITNETVAPLYLQGVLDALGQRQVDVYQLPDGEAYKTLESFEAVTTFLLNARHNLSKLLCSTNVLHKQSIVIDHHQVFNHVAGLSSDRVSDCNIKL